MTDPLTVLGLERGVTSSPPRVASTATASPTWSPSSPDSAKPSTGRPTGQKPPQERPQTPL